MSLATQPFKNRKLYAQVAFYNAVEAALYEDYQCSYKIDEVLEVYDVLEEYIESRNDYRNPLSSRLEIMRFKDYKNDSRYDDLEFPPLEVSIKARTRLLVFIPHKATHQLNQELDRIYKSLLPEPKDITRRENIVQQIENVLSDVWNQNYKVKVYGSAANGFGFHDSDMDLAIIAPEYDSPTVNKRKEAKKKNSIMNMHRLAHVLRNCGMVNVMAVPNANVPICKFDVLPYGIHCDISVNNLMGTNNTRLLKAYSEIDQRVKPFIYAIKNFVKHRDINDASAGSLSSYSYTLMGLWYLMTCDPPVIPNLQNPKGFSDRKCFSRKCHSHQNTVVETEHKNSYIHANIHFHDCFRTTSFKQNGSKEIRNTKNGLVWATRNEASIDQLLIDFFFYYGAKHDFSRAISVRLNRLMFKPDIWKGQPIAIEDPFITSRNVGTSCNRRGLDYIRRLFVISAHTLATKRFSFDSACSMTYDDLVKAGSSKMAKFLVLDRLQDDNLPVEKVVLLSGIPIDYKKNMLVDTIVSGLSNYGKVESIKRWRVSEDGGFLDYRIEIEDINPYVLLPTTIHSTNDDGYFDLTELFELFCDSD
ncbi:hypothetical protein CLU79DRAFT_834205 [Phycomyces nitens]|nr:hypothetical protein CLU79DRAFT_834205 [Phycomyces nitens]